MKITYHGHSFLEVKTDSHTILIDPFMTGNSLCEADPNTIEADVILLTHGHNDHVGDTVAIAKRTNAQIVSIVELTDYLGRQGLSGHGMNLGGGYTFDFGHVKFTQAFHSSSYEEADGTTVFTGVPAGIILTVEGKSLYHVGDTALFSDLKLIGDTHDIDIAFIPIGDNFTMGPEEALTAADWINAKRVVPIHYNTFPVIEQDGEAFAKAVRTGEGICMKPGATLEI